jgi:hypothetical protein
LHPRPRLSYQGFNVFSEEDKNKANGLKGPNKPDKQNEKHPKKRDLTFNKLLFAPTSLSTSKRVNDISLCTNVPFVLFEDVTPLAPLALSISSLCA